MKSLAYFVVALLLVGSVAAIGIGKEASNVTKTNESPETPSSAEFVRPVYRNNIPIPEKIEMTENRIPLASKHTFLPTDIPIVSTEDSEIHPTLTTYGDGLLFGGFTLDLSILENEIWFAYSGDGGSTWTIPNGINPENGVFDYVAMDYLGTGNAIVVTWQPDPAEYDGAGQWRVIMTDPLDTETWDGASWDWSSQHGYSDLKNPDIAGYDFNGEPPHPSYYGWMIGTVSNSGYGYKDGPAFYFANGEDEGSGWIWSWGDSETTCTHSAVDIDRGNGMMYSAWEYYNETADTRDILLANGYLEDYLAADYHDWGPDPTWQELGGSEMNKYPDVAAANGYVYVACQADVMIPGKEDIICFYSHDGGETWDVSNVAVDSVQNEMYPSIVAYGEGASITYIADGDLYVTHTDDGGETWSTPEQRNEVGGTVVAEENAVDIHSAGIVWTDNRNGDKDIYYAPVTDAPFKPNTPDGPTSGKTGQSQTYSTSSVDPNGDDISYGWDWDGDDVVDEWTGFNPSGTPVSTSHTWDAEYIGEIKVKAKDTNDDESLWSNPLSVSMPKNKAVTYPLLQRFLEIFPNAFPILRYLLRL